MPEANPYYSQIEDRARRAAEVKATLVNPFRADDGTFIGASTRAEQAKRNQIMESATANTAYSMAKSGPMIAAIHARALQGYERQHGHLPSDDLLASAHQAIENAFMITTGKKPGIGVFEAADMSTTDGILMRDRLISLVLPVLLHSITANMVTHIPGEFNQSEFFRVFRVAGSNFGTLKKGDPILYNYDGVYSVMDQRQLMATADGSTATFKFATSSMNGVVYPIKPKRCRIWVDHYLVAADDGNKGIVGSYTLPDDTRVTISGAANYADGEIEVTFSQAPTSGLELHVGFDVNIEADPSLIPRVDHQMFSRLMYPHESAINGDATIQAVWALRRELGQDIDNLTMQGLRNLLAADKDRKHLHDMMFHCTHNIDWVRTGHESLTLREHYESLNAALLDVDTWLMKSNGTSGLVGIVAGSEACNIFRYLPQPWFTPSPGYRSVAQPHYVGTVFGQWALYCNPQAANGWECLCYAKGPDYGQTAYVAGDAVPALTFRHPILGDLVQRATMWDLSYRDMQPFDGEKYLCKLSMID